MAETSVPVRYIDEITECPICRKVFNDPVGLPCFHTFCLKCIDGWAAARKPAVQNTLTCPLCRKEIEVTREQIAQLPRNLFVEKLLEIRKLSGSRFSDSNATCDICVGNSTPAVVGVHCVECRQNLCSQCSDYHRNISVFRSHHLTQRHGNDVGAVADTDDLMIKLSDEACDKHRGEQLKIYCIDCKTVHCILCFIKDHKSHACSDINDVVEELKKNVKSDGDGVDMVADELKCKISKLDDRQRAFLHEADKTQQEIVDTAENLKTAIEQRKRELLRELEQTKKTELKQIETTREELEGRLMMINSFKKYTDQLRDKGSACDIARQSAGLRTRAKELLMLGSAGDLEADIALSTRVAFNLPVASLSQLTEIMDILTVTSTSENDGRLCSQQSHLPVQTDDQHEILYRPMSAPASPSSRSPRRLTQVLVSGLWNSTVAVVVRATDKVENLKSSIEEKYGIPANKQQLTYCGKQLHDEYPLSHYGIVHYSTLYLCPQFI